MLKEGVGEDSANRSACQTAALRARTDEGVSLADYVGRMEGRPGGHLLHHRRHPGRAKSSPQLEIFRKKGIEVLLLTDRVDEWMLSHLYEFEAIAAERGQGRRSTGQLQDEEEKQAEDRRQPSSRCSSA